jgi:hypothetical protein
MNPIKFECPHCHEIISGDESLYGQRVKCRKCQADILVPQAPSGTQPQTPFSASLMKLAPPKDEKHGQLLEERMARDLAQTLGGDWHVCIAHVALMAGTLAIGGCATTEPGLPREQALWRTCIRHG